MNKKNIVWFGICLVLFLPSIWGLVHPGLFVSDDGNWMVIRFSAFYEALRHGEFPVRFLPRLLNGYGYPVADFLYPLFMYLGVPIHIVGLRFVDTIKVIYGLSLIGSGVFCYVWLKKAFDPKAAFIGALVYVYFPYHLFDLYTRGSIGEMLALCIVPGILWQVEKKNIILVSFGISLLVLAHNTLAIMFLPVLLLYYFLQQRNIKTVAITLLLGLGMSAFFWVPALFDKQYTVFDRTSVSHFEQYFLGISNWYIAGLLSSISLGFGVIGIIKRSKIVVFFEIILLLSLFLTLPFSHIVWHLLPLGKYVQFPFRFLSLVILASSYLVAYGLFVMKKYSKLLVGIFAVIVTLSALPVLIPKSYQYYPDSWYSTNQDSTTVQNEYLPLWVNTVPTNKTTVAELIKGDGMIHTEQQNSTKIQITTFIKKDAELQINTLYFPGWSVKIDGRPTSVVYANDHGLMQIAISPGQHMITASFGETPLRMVVDMVSLLTIVGIGGVALLQYTRR